MDLMRVPKGTRYPYANILSKVSSEVSLFWLTEKDSGRIKAGSLTLAVRKKSAFSTSLEAPKIVVPRGKLITPLWVDKLVSSANHYFWGNTKFLLVGRPMT